MPIMEHDDEYRWYAPEGTLHTNAVASAPSSYKSYPVAMGYAVNGFVTRLTQAFVDEHGHMPTSEGHEAVIEIHLGDSEISGSIFERPKRG